MNLRRAQAIMRRGSTTFFNSSLFFPAAVRRDVLILYAFVRTADDYVDRQPQDEQGIRQFRELYCRATQGEKTGNEIVDAFAELARQRGFEDSWVESFLNAMELDLTKKTYATLEETEHYMHGSAEVVGMMMAKVLSLPGESLPYARMLGRAFQYVNFLRDVREDLELGRVYLPAEEVRASGLDGLTLDNATLRPESFERLIRSQTARYREWRSEAARGFRFIPKRYLIAIKTAADLYDQTANEIDRDPMIVLQRKLKPTKLKAMLTGARHLFGVCADGGWIDGVWQGRKRREV